MLLPMPWGTEILPVGIKDGSTSHTTIASLSALESMVLVCSKSNQHHIWCGKESLKLWQRIQQFTWAHLGKMREPLKSVYFLSLSSFNICMSIMSWYRLSAISLVSMIAEMWEKKTRNGEREKRRLSYLFKHSLLYLPFKVHRGKRNIRLGLISNLDELKRLTLHMIVRKERCMKLNH